MTSDASEARRIMDSAELRALAAERGSELRHRWENIACECRHILNIAPASLIEHARGGQIGPRRDHLRLVGAPVDHLDV